MDFPMPPCAEMTLDSLVWSAPQRPPKKIAVRERSGFWTWTLPGNGDERYRLALSYHQAMENGIVHYVLSSSQSWPEPIGHVRIVVTTPPDGVLLGSYYLEPKWVVPKPVYLMEATDFVSDRDLVLYWESTEGGTGSLEGRVVDTDGTPMAFATVQIRAQKRGATAAEDGHFQIRDVAAGTYWVQAVMTGHSGVEGRVVVLPGTATEIEVVFNAMP